MTNSEINAKCAEVMGWIQCGVPAYWRCSPDRREVDDWNPSTNASDDYEVLKWVRERWDKTGDRGWVFYATITRRFGAWDYEPGDYARALVAALEGAE